MPCFQLNDFIANSLGAQATTFFSMTRIFVPSNASLAAEESKQKYLTSCLDIFTIYSEYIIFPFIRIIH